MIKRLLALALISVPLAASAATYSYVGVPYLPASINNYTAAPCGAGTCADFLPTMYQSGSFTTSATLGANLNNSNISHLITSYNFSDGLHVFSGTTIQPSPLGPYVFTDANGDITGGSFFFIKWQGPGQAVNDRVESIAVGLQSSANLICGNVNAGECLFASSDSSSSQAGANGGVWTTSLSAVSPTAVPVDSPLALALLVLVVAGMAITLRLHGGQPASKP